MLTLKITNKELDSQASSAKVSIATLFSEAVDVSDPHGILPLLKTWCGFEKA